MSTVRYQTSSQKTLYRNRRCGLAFGQQKKVLASPCCSFLWLDNLLLSCNSYIAILAILFSYWPPTQLSYWSFTCSKMYRQASEKPAQTKSDCIGLDKITGITVPKSFKHCLGHLISVEINVTLITHYTCKKYPGNMKKISGKLSFLADPSHETVPSTQRKRGRIRPRMLSVSCMPCRIST